MQLHWFLDHSILNHIQECKNLSPKLAFSHHKMAGKSFMYIVPLKHKTGVHQTTLGAWCEAHS
jgi:hypothetical protein